MDKIAVGAEFDSFDDFQDATRDAGVVRRFTFNVYKCDKSRCILRCSVKECPFSVTAIDSKRAGGIIVTQLVDIHHCARTIAKNRNSQMNSKWLQKRARETMVVDKSQKPSSIMKQMNLTLHASIKYHSAYKIRDSLLLRSLELQRLQFQKFEAYAEKLVHADPTTFAGVLTTWDYMTTPPNERFDRFIVIPGAAKVAWRNLRPFVAVDGTFTKNLFKQILLLAVGFDCNSNIVILAYAVVPNECKDMWRWFLTMLDRQLPGIHDDDVIITNDRQKGLLDSMEKVFPELSNCYCCYHLADNVRKYYGKKCQKMFWKLVYARTREYFVAKLAEIAKVNKKCAEYIDAIDHSCWATYAVPGRRYGHVTSNLAEIANSMLTEIRGLAPLDLVHEIYKHEMHTFHLRHQASLACKTPLCPAAMKLLETADDEGRLQRATPAHQFCGSVLNPFGIERVVTLPRSEAEAGTCSCKKYQGLDLPCKHACAFARHADIKVPPLSLCSVHYQTATYRDTYSHPYAPIDLDIAGLRESMTREPLHRCSIGRPPTIRRPSGPSASATGKRKNCGECGLSGHYRQTCPGLPPASQHSHAGIGTPIDWMVGPANGNEAGPSSCSVTNPSSASLVDLLTDDSDSDAEDFTYADDWVDEDEIIEL